MLLEGLEVSCTGLSYLFSDGVIMCFVYAWEGLLLRYWLIVPCRTLIRRNSIAAHGSDLEVGGASGMS